MNSEFETLYERQNRIGTGTFGKVYRCQRKSDGRLFAVKEIDIENDSILHQVLKEITLMEKTQDSPYMIKYIQHFQTKDTILIVMELAQGGDLYQYLVTKQRLDADEIEVILYQLLLAVKQLHEMKIMHRDIKTENILKVQHGIKLGDLGLSTQVSGSLAGADSVVGTPIFNAPERFKKGYDFNVDIWSVGMVLYQLLQNKLPSYPEIYNGQRDPIDAHYPQHIRDILDDMLILEPTKRPHVHEVISKLMWSRSIRNVKLCFDGSILQGQRVNELLQGIGICYYSNGDRYEGYWVQGKRHGFGTHYCANGRNFNGNWINDQLPTFDQKMLTGSKDSSLEEQDSINQLKVRFQQLSQQNQVLLNFRKDLMGQLQLEKQSNVQLQNQKNRMSFDHQKEIQIYKEKEKAADNQNKVYYFEQQKLLQSVQSSLYNQQRINNEFHVKLQKLEEEQETKKSENKSLLEKNQQLLNENGSLKFQLVQLKQNHEQSKSDQENKKLEFQSPPFIGNFQELSYPTIYACVFKSNGCRNTFFTAIELSNHQQICHYKQPKQVINQPDFSLPQYFQPTLSTPQKSTYQFESALNPQNVQLPVSSAKLQRKISECQKYVKESDAEISFRMQVRRNFPSPPPRTQSRTSFCLIDYDQQTHGQNQISQQLLIPKFKEEMAVSISTSWLTFEAQFNSKKLIEWTIINKCQEPWPCQPLLLNKNTNEKQQVQQILKPDESFTIKYLFSVPEKSTMGVLQLVNPYSFQSFGDTFTFHCHVDTESFINQDFSQIESENTFILDQSVIVENSFALSDEKQNDLDVSITAQRGGIRQKD